MSDFHCHEPLGEDASLINFEFHPVLISEASSPGRCSLNSLAAIVAVGT
jgi:hypothetical protein